MTEWNFDTSNPVTIDDLYYYLDKTNGIAECAGIVNRNTLKELKVPASISVDGVDYTVVSLSNRRQYYQDSVRTVSGRFHCPIHCRELARMPFITVATSLR